MILGFWVGGDGQPEDQALIPLGSASTNNLHGHLLQIHQLANPKLSNKAKTNHMDISKWGKTGALHPKA
ncbi:uncharacterized protein VP01_4873g3 [Puccinia sorghi]|uniref:Uncharacterized protein n=1 Tax=Puccinia sorghi TaxID=27349 RepID=A0A0L6UN07_9BASI|nr:uncharacterized protein VP01_4873g3 [Puccinia sorghi]